MITEADRLGQGGPKAKFRDNVAAIKTLKRLQSEGAEFASPADQALLVKYVGWGGLPQAFDDDNPDWARESAELRQLLTPGEYAQARSTVKDAHYTSPEVIQGIYQGLQRLGFTGEGAKILEPSSGIGNFLGLMPAAMRAGRPNIQAVELDGLTSAIGRYLYPGAFHVHAPFQEANPPEGYFDLAMGNPPFGNQRVYDASRPDLNYSIHNYFLAKSVESLREGGLAAFVVSRYFLDAVDNPAREFLAERANLLGAIRLPNTAFKQNALTEVTTDIVFFQKTSAPEKDPAWLKTGQFIAGDGQPITVNQYFLERPEQMIGHMAITGGMHQGAADLVPPADFKGFAEEIGRRLASLPERVYSPRPTMEQEAQARTPGNLELCAGLKPGSLFFTQENQLARRLPDVMGAASYTLLDGRNKRDLERVSGMILIRDTLTQLMEEEGRADSDDMTLAARRAQLNRVYDAFVQKHGFLNSQACRRAMREDPSYPLLSSLERDYSPGVSKDVAKKNGVPYKPPSATKAAIFSQRVLGPRPHVSHVETAKEALVVSMNEYGRVDLPFMESLCQRPREDVLAELRGLIYLNPANQAWEIADHYLTGEVKEKLRQAQAAAETDHRFAGNVEALLAVQPPDLDPVDIAIQLGSTWVPPDVVADFGRELFGWRSVQEIGYHPALGAWAVSFNKLAIDPTAATAKWGTSKYYGHKLFEAILNNKAIKVMEDTGEKDDRGKPIMRLNEAETAAASQKADEIRQAFKDWVWQDKERRDRLARLYNDRFNTHVPRRYNGSHLELPGISLNVELRPHQKDAIWRNIQDGTALLDHVVGAGKTWTVVATIMESRRMGLMKKPMVVVPNHLLPQWQDAFYSLYPQAKVLVATKDDFSQENREKLFAKVATGDWDAVVVAHSSFKKIGLPPATLNKVLNEQVDDLTEAIRAARAEAGQRTLVKEMEKTRDKLKAMMQRKAKTGEKDQGVTFADLGVDALFVDESQEFKNLYITTKMRNVAGLGNLVGSQKAFDLFVKCRYLQEKNNGRGVFFATGTPLSNSIAEMFTVQRFLQYDELKRKGLAHFDSWASTFGQVATGWELDATGVGYKLNNRFAKFQNVPELIRMYRAVGDVVTNSDIVANNHGVSFTPKVKGGKPINVVVPRSEMQARYMGVQTPLLDAMGRPIHADDGSPVMEWNEGSIIYRMEHLPKDPREDNPLCVTNDARKAGLDYRLIDPNAPDFPGSKVNVAAAKIVDIWKKWEAQKGTQLVFCDLSTPKAGKDVPLTQVAEAGDGLDPEDAPAVTMDEILAESSPFSVYDDLKAKLIDRGIPSEQIKFIHEANTDLQKAKLFEDVNQGRVRVLIGSTAKMGAGTNVQARLVALHHLDAPWRPSDLEQREGRIIRQGNLFHQLDPEGFEVEIYRYATEKTYDARMWQTIQGKAEGIEQFRKGDLDSRVIDDIASEAANAAEMKAAATGNEMIFTQVKLAAELKKMEAIYASFQRSQHQLEKRIEHLEAAPARTQKEIEGWQAEIALRDGKTTQEPCFAADGRVYGPQQKEKLLETINKKLKIAVDSNEVTPVGVYRGFKVSVCQTLTGECQFILKGEASAYHPSNLRYGRGDKLDVGGFYQRLDNFMAKFEKSIQEAQDLAAKQAQELANARKDFGQPFPQMGKLAMLRRDNRDVMRELQLMRKDGTYKSQWKPPSLEPERPAPRPVVAHDITQGHSYGLTI